MGTESVFEELKEPRPERVEKKKWVCVIQEWTQSSKLVSVSALSFTELTIQLDKKPQSSTVSVT